MDERAPLSDDVLDRELQQALAVEPSPAFAAGVRQRTASETMASAPWMRGWAYVSGAAVVASAVAVVMMVGSSPDAPVSAPVIPARRLAVPAAPEVAAPAPVKVAPGSSRTTRIELPEVVVPPGQERAMRMFAEAAWEQRAQPAPASDEAVDKPLQLAPIELAPVDIEPLPQMAALEGERP